MLRERDLAAVLSEATGLAPVGGDAQVRPRAACLQRFELALDGDRVVLSTWPGELIGQAKAFYGDPSRVARLLDLGSASPWSVRPNGHLAYWLAPVGRRWYFIDGSLDAADYMRQWQDDLSEVHGYPRDAVATELCPWLLRRGYAGERDRPRMEEFLAHARPEVHLRPGVWVSRTWPLDEAARLHERGELVRAVREAVGTALATLGEPPLRS